MIETIHTAWSWTGLVPAEVINANPFGNVIVKAIDGAYWRIRPETLTCEKVADDHVAFFKVWKSQNFRFDWDMATLVSIAKDKLGTLEEDRCYCFKLSPVLGGTYDGNNMSSISIKELIAFSGHLAERLKDVPDGGKVKIEWIE
jgi:hypothetical protein